VLAGLLVLLLALAPWVLGTDLYCESRLDKNLWAELAVLWFNSWKTAKMC